MTKSNRFASAEELNESITALSTAYATRARELERYEVQIWDLSDVLVMTTNSTDRSKQLMLKSLGANR